MSSNPDRVVATRITLPVVRYPTYAQRLRFYGLLLECVERLPGAPHASIR